MTEYKSEIKVIVPRVEKYGPKPTNGVEALQQAHAFLAEEGQWVRGSFFQDGDPKEAYEKSACGNWRACAMGALGLVTGEQPVKVSHEWYEGTEQDRKEDWRRNVWHGETEVGLAEWIETHPIDGERRDERFRFEVGSDYSAEVSPISHEAAAILATSIKGFRPGNPVDAVIQFNDDSDYGVEFGRTRVLDAFAEAIRDAGAELIVDHA